MDTVCIPDTLLRAVGPQPSRPLVAEEQFLICRPQDRLARRRSVTLAEVADLPLVLPSREHGLRFAVEDRINSIGSRANIQMEIDSIVGLRRFVERGKVYTILPRGELEEDVVVGRLAAVRIVKPTIHRILFVAWHTRNGRCRRRCEQSWSS